MAAISKTADRSVFNLRAGMLPLSGRRLLIVCVVSIAISAILAGVGCVVVARGRDVVCAFAFFFGLCLSFLVRGLLDRKGLSESSIVIISADGVKLPGFLIDQGGEVFLPVKDLGQFTLVTNNVRPPNHRVNAFYLRPPSGGLLNFSPLSFEEPIEEVVRALEKHLNVKWSFKT